MRGPKHVRGWLAGAVIAGTLALGGCAEPGGNAAPGGGGSSVPAGGETVGTISIQLTLASVFRFDHVDYDISGNGFHTASSVDVGASSTISTTVGGIPFGHGYVVQLATQDVEHRLAPCTGVASFDITSAATVPVPVHLACHEAPKVVAQAVPVPRWAGYGLAALLLLVGVAATRRRTAR